MVTRGERVVVMRVCEEGGGGGEGGEEEEERNKENINGRLVYVNICGGPLSHCPSY